jgi:hypothetical protein
VRNDSLDLLSHMLDLANEDGSVELDGPLLQIEKLLGVSQCIDAYSWLEALDVIERTASGWEIPNFADHRGPVGVTAASFAVLRRHLDAVGEEDLAPAIGLVPSLPHDEVPVRTVALRRWRRTVPLAAAGVAASVAALTGVAQFLPQAASTNRPVALRADAPLAKVPTSVANAATDAVTAATSAATGSAKATASTTPAATIDTPAGIGGPLTSIVCGVPKLLGAVTSVSIVQLPLQFDESGKPLWAAVVSGTVTNTTAETIVLQSLTVVAHVVDGDTAPVSASLPSPLLLGNTVSPFTTVVALGSVRPAETITATAKPTASGASATC